MTFRSRLAIASFSVKFQSHARFSPLLRHGWPFTGSVREYLHERQESLRRRLDRQECNLAAVADAEDTYSFFACKITC